MQKNSEGSTSLGIGTVGRSLSRGGMSFYSNLESTVGTEAVLSVSSTVRPSFSQQEYTSSYFGNDLCTCNVIRLQATCEVMGKNLLASS